MNKQQKILLIVLAIFVIGFFTFDIQRFFSLDYLQSEKKSILQFRDEHIFQSVVFYILIYILVTSLSLPGATILTLAGGAVFGLFWGTFIVSFASTIGASLAFAASRYLFKNFIQSRYSSHLKTIDQGIKKDGIFYLLSLRLIPIVPFFVINLVMGLTNIRLLTFYWVSQIGMLPGTLVYVNAGTQLAKIESLSDVLSPGIIGAFVVLGLFPLLAKRTLDVIKSRKIYKKWIKPTHFDTNVVVIGAGSAGLVTSYIASALQAKVTLVEKADMGGDCLNTGCVPSKALIRTTRFLSQARRCKTLGVNNVVVDYSFTDVMHRVRTIITKIAPHDSVERYTDLGVDVVQGEAKIETPWCVSVNTGKGEKKIATRSIVIATGASPFIPPIPGLNQVPYLTSDTLWDLTQLPRQLLVLGGGAIGCELAQCFQRLGSQVTQVEMLPRILIKEDQEVSDLIMQCFEKEGIDIRVNHTAKEFVQQNNGYVLIAEHQGEMVEIPFDYVLVAIGRKANVNHFGVEEMEISISPNGMLETNEFQQTNYPNIFACGDVAGPYQFTHMAGHQAWYAAVNALFGEIKKFKTDYRVVPWATFCDLEVARVGINELDAKQQGISYERIIYHFDELDRALVDGETEGFIKVLTPPGKDKILGVTIVGQHASDLIAEFVLAMRWNLGLNKVLSTIHIYPTRAEANKYIAGQWRKKHSPKKLMTILNKFHAWKRH